MRPRGPAWRRMSDGDPPPPWEPAVTFMLCAAAVLFLWYAYVAGWLAAGGKISWPE